jgi:predicted DNA-binding transcriptional regulator AlpA
MSDDTTILSVIQTCQRLGMHRATLRREEKRGNPHFPKKIILSAGRIGYLKSDVEKYIAWQQSPDAWHHRRNAA